MVSTTGSANITEDEAQLYDRQIRLWGLDAQKRLRASRVLVAGLRGLGCEVAKNLVLSGVKSLRVLDGGTLSEEDLESNFLCPVDKVGSNRAETAVDRLQQLNPMVEVSFDAGDVDAKPEEYFRDFDIVLVTCSPRDVLVRVNNLCHKNGVKFFAGDVHGFFGYSFMDLVEHEFVEEVRVKVKAEVEADNGPTPAKKAKKDKEEEEEEEEETKMVKRSLHFVSLEDALKVDWCSGGYAKRVRRMDGAFFLLHVLYEFQSREGRSPQMATREGDLKLLESLADSVASKFGLPEGKMSKDLPPMLFTELSPVAAIVGGILAQEIIKVISNKDEPHRNFFLYNPLESAGIVEDVGAAA